MRVEPSRQAPPHRLFYIENDQAMPVTEAAGQQKPTRDVFHELLDQGWRVASITIASAGPPVIAYVVLEGPLAS